MKLMVKLIAIVMLSWTCAINVKASPIDTYQFQNMDNQKRAVSLAQELRCPQCQNQNLVDSNSPVARDLRIEVYKMVDEGKSNDEIIDFMTSRYGDFVLYLPRVETKTYILWGGPIALFILGLLTVLFLVRRQKKASTLKVELSKAQQQELQRILKESKK